MERKSKRLDRLLSITLMIAIVITGFLPEVTSQIKLHNEIKQITDLHKKQYDTDQYTEDLYCKVADLASELDLFVYTMKLVDNYIFDENDLKDYELYADLIIYGDEYYERANTLDYKVTATGLMVGILNFRMDKVNACIYSLGPERFLYSFLWKNINDHIIEINKLINQYNTMNNTDLCHIERMKEIDIKAGKEYWELLEETSFPQGVTYEKYEYQTIINW